MVQRSCLINTVQISGQYFYFILLSFLQEAGMNHYSQSQIINAARYPKNHKDEMETEIVCGCYSCTSIFFPNEIKEYQRAKDHRSVAVCPFCNSPTVIGSRSGYPIRKDFLEEMKQYWSKEDYLNSLKDNI